MKRSQLLDLFNATYWAAATFSALPLRAARHSSKRRTPTKNDGTNSTARQVEASMPLNTPMPIDLRELAPAPIASTTGSTTRKNAKQVIRMGRSRVPAGWCWYESAVHWDPVPGGDALAAICSISAIASPELKPVAGNPNTVEDG